jgi:hypothetical protein
MTTALQRDRVIGLRHRESSGNGFERLGLGEPVVAVVASRVDEEDVADGCR